MQKEQHREDWLDIAKCIAIFAVVIDHASTEINIKQEYAYMFFFSVSLFVIVMGYANYKSYERNHSDVYNKLKKRMIGILRPYLAASFVFSVISSGGFYFDKYITELIHFSASPPLYYISVFIQLILVSPVLYKILAYNNKGYEFLCFTGILLLSCWSNNYTHILQIYGGGGKLFGGTYLLVFYIGMLMGKYCRYFETDVLARYTKPDIQFCIIFFIASVFIAFFISINQFTIEKTLFFGKGVNPPGLCLMIYSLTIAFLIFFLCRVLNRSQKILIKKTLSCLIYIGRHTLYIFLYHKLFQDYFLRIMFMYVNIGRQLNGFAYVISMIVGPLLIECLFKRIYGFIISSYSNVVIIKN